MRSVKDILYKAWMRLTEPLVPIEDPFGRQHMRFIASVSLLVLIAAALSVIATSFQIHRSLPPEVTIIGVGLSTFFLPYLLARSGKPLTAVVAHVIIGSLNLFIASWLLPSAQERQFVLVYLSLVTLYGVAFLPLRTTILLVGVQLIALWVFLITVLRISPHQAFWDALQFNLIASMCSIALVTYWRRREAAQRQEVIKSEQRYRVISEMTSDYMFFVRCTSPAERRLEWVTESVTQITGYTPAESLAATESTVFPEDVPQVLEDRTKVLAGESVESVYRFFRRDGALRWVSTLRRPAYDDANRIIGYYGAVRDITERKQAEQDQFQLALRREQFSMVEQFINAMSHDFRNRLASIESSRHIIQRITEPLLAPNQAEQMTPRMETIQGSIAQMIEQLDNLSLVAGLARPNRVAIDVGTLLQTVCKRLTPVAESLGMRLLCEAPVVHGHLNGDHGQIEGALKQLISNALSHSRTGESVTIRAMQDGDHIMIEVEDQGEGIPASALDHIFEPFYKVGAARTITLGGVGVGLTIVKMIMDAHGGKVEVKSQENVGSRFRLLFPAAAQG